MKLTELLKNTKVVHSQYIEGVEIEDVEYYSNDVKKGALFFCIKGLQDDGHLYIDAALSNGAVGFVVSKEYFEIAKKASFENPYRITYDRLINSRLAIVVVEDTVAAVSKLSAAFYKYPSREMNCIGVTGTNGKTSITYMLESILKHAKKSPGVIGTVSYRYNGKECNDVDYTTPKSLFLHRMMRTMRNEGVTHLSMEVSSHGIEMQRVTDIDFDIAIFTNLTRDHIDFHKDMENYFNAKKKLFINILNKSCKKEKYAIINSDCEYGVRLAEILRKDFKSIKTITVGFAEESDCCIKGLETHEHGSDFTVKNRDKVIEFKIPFVGKHNIFNAAASAVAAIDGLKIDLPKVKEGLAKLGRIPGRLDRVRPGFNIFVDYAHTDDALKNVISALKVVFYDKKLITIFGCGGDRDKGKRPRMGNVATTLSDFAIVTSDNPRTEEPQAIVNDILPGIKSNNYKVILNRKEAIDSVISSMNPDTDVILIAGKGHENYQEIKGIKHHFDDREIANQALDKRGRS